MYGHYLSKVPRYAYHCSPSIADTVCQQRRLKVQNTVLDKAVGAVVGVVLKTRSMNRITATGL